MSHSELPFAVLAPMTVLLVAVVLNVLLCSAGRVGAVFALPSALAGRMITILEGRYNTPHATDSMRRADSVSVAIVLLLVGIGAGLGAGYLFEHLPYSWIVEAMLIATFINVRPHLERLGLLERAAKGDADEARATLTMVTGRDSTRLDRPEIAAAAIESTAMALPQGLIAPLVWYWLGGLPGLLAFKIIDTASVMIDERAENARSFGHAPRALSAVFIAPAAVMSAVVILLASLLLPHGRCLRAVRGLLRGGRYAWPVFSLPVAAVSGALSVRLGGNVCIGSFERGGDVFGPDAPLPEPEDIARARRLFLVGTILSGLVVAGLGGLGLAHPIKLY